MVEVFEYPLTAIERITMDRNRLQSEVERLQAMVATSDRLRAEDAMELLRCQSAMREWQELSTRADDREVTARKEVDRLTAQLEAARVAVERMPGLKWHAAYCASLERSLSKPVQRCDCGADATNAARTEARRAVGLEG